MRAILGQPGSLAGHCDLGCLRVFEWVVYSLFQHLWTVRVGLTRKNQFPMNRILTILILFLSLRSLAGEQATAEATLTAGYVTDIAVTAPGSGYQSEPTVTITGGGGTGATAKAILTGDRVGFIVVLSAGSGYKSTPLVAIEPPPQDWELAVRLVPEITVYGSQGAIGRVEWSTTIETGAQSSWQLFTNILMGSESVRFVDPVPGSSTRFYRAASGPTGFVYIPPGSFVMGSPLTEAGRGEDETQHTVTLTQGYWMCDHEVTQAEYKSVVGTNPSQFKGVDLPVETVSWAEAVEFCRLLTSQEFLAGRLSPGHVYRLPTEAEWEYAARGGSASSRPTDIGLYAWYGANAGVKTHPVKTKLPNAWGLYDTLGNVWEWCSDWLVTYPSTPAINPQGAASGTSRVIRGGSLGEGGSVPRLAARYNYGTPGDRIYNIGFRIVLAVGLPGSPALGWRAGQQATATATVTAGYVTDITLTSGGSGYSTPPDITIVGGGGQGAEAKAILNGDKVALVIVVNSGSGYTSIPVVTLGASSPEFELGVRLVPEISVSGPAGSVSRIEYVERLAPRVISEWQVLTNVAIGKEGVTVVDLAAGSSARTYRLVAGVSAPLLTHFFVTVGDAGNAKDPATGYGAVGYTFQIQKFEFTNAEYVEFLNAVGGSNPNGIYSPDMASDPRGGITQSGASPNAVK